MAAPLVALISLAHCGDPPPLLVTAATAPAAPSVSGYDTPDSDAIPPERFRHDTVARVVTVGTQSALEADCGKPASGTRLACVQRDGAVIMPNPCHFTDEYYARLLCHELGHVQRWGANHER